MACLRCVRRLGGSRRPSLPTELPLLFLLADPILLGVAVCYRYLALYASSNVLIRRVRTSGLAQARLRMPASYEGSPRGLRLSRWRQLSARTGRRAATAPRHCRGQYDRHLLTAAVKERLHRATQPRGCRRIRAPAPSGRTSGARLRQSGGDRRSAHKAQETAVNQNRPNH